MRPATSVMLAALLLLCCGTASALTPLDAGAMDANVTIRNTVTFAQEDPAYLVDFASGVLLWYPRESQLQDVDGLTAVPVPTMGPEGLKFSWDHPDGQEQVLVDARVRTRNAIVPVRTRIAFPLEDVPADLDPYLAYGKTIDTSPAIERQASALAAGKDDAYEVVAALADWTTRNVNYSLDSLRAPAIQSASQVMLTRRGKCDELTALFISMNRALGIPTRFVAGYSYTDSDQFENAWGGHGWAEVWLPDAGWVPFDVTYGEYGYLDAGHIPMSVSADAKETSVSFEARGHGFRIETQPLDIAIVPTDLSHEPEPGIRIALDAPRSRVGFGSVVLILAAITNDRDAYVSTRLDLAQTKDTALLSDTYANILLHPYEQRTIPFLVRISDDLASGYRYEFPFALRARLGVESTVTVEVTQDGPQYTAEDFADALTTYRVSGDGAAPLSVTCDRGTSVYVGETSHHRCHIDSAPTDAITICLAGDCSRIPVIDGGFSLDVPTVRAGSTTTVYAAQLAGRTTDVYVTTRAVAPTDVRIVISAPASVGPQDSFEVIANVSASGAMPLNVTATLVSGRSSASEAFERIGGPVLLRFAVPSRVLRPGANELSLTLAFTDELGTRQSAMRTVNVELAGLSWWDQVSLWFDEMGYRLENALS